MHLDFVEASVPVEGSVGFRRVSGGSGQQHELNNGFISTSDY